MGNTVCLFTTDTLEIEENEMLSLLSTGPAMSMLCEDARYNFWLICGSTAAVLSRESALESDKGTAGFTEEEEEEAVGGGESG